MKYDPISQEYYVSHDFPDGSNYPPGVDSRDSYFDDGDYGYFGPIRKGNEMQYNVVDANGTICNQEPFDSEREAYQGKSDYQQHWREADLVLPLSVVRAQFSVEHPHLKSLSESQSEDAA